jgi:hypothetical protein
VRKLTCSDRKALSPFTYPYSKKGEAKIRKMGIERRKEISKCRKS